MGILQTIAVLLCVSATTYADPLGNFVPQELIDCVNRVTPLANATGQKASVSPVHNNQRENAGLQAGVEIAIDYAGTDVPRLKTLEDVHMFCIQQFMWKPDRVRWENYNITKTDMEFVNGLLESMMKPTWTKQSRSKRYSGGRDGMIPPTGFRIRREYRRISDGERNAFHGALRMLKMNGEYDMFANLHRGIVTDSAHGGANFLGWHRVYLALFEEAMRRIDRRISLPYWDSTLDFDMANPADSILFSPAFLGNGDGVVTTGPFANWAAINGPLTRNIGGTSSLFTKENIRMILTRCRTSEITRPTALPPFDFEGYHGGAHLWVGGQLADITTAAHDPVFFLHHAFVDFIWEMFRMHQVRDCRVNPNVDYPDAPGLHAAFRPMDGFPEYVNNDGYRSYWTQMWFRYERSPSCPVCGSPYLRCDPARGVCVSVERMLSADEGAPLATGALGFSATERAASPSAALARAQVAMLPVGRLFDGPPPEPRTQEGQAIIAGLGALRRKRRAVQQKDMVSISSVSENSNQKYISQPLEIGEKFLGPKSDGRTLHVLGRNISSDVFAGQNVEQAPQDVYSGNAFPVAEPMSFFPVPGSDSLDSYMQYPSSYTSNSSASDWLFVPVQVTYTVDGTDNSAQTPSTKCLPSDAISTHIKVSAQGLNYLGEYTDYTVVDTRYARSSAHGIIAMRAPEIGPSITKVTASHGCGLMCKPTCITSETGTFQYKPCSGIMWITPKDATAYVRSYDKAAEIVARGGAKFPILFQCHKESQSP
ncbi:LOW QUALITY PROTEIN: uncharacterized protein LOC127854901 [Dreissena polymorpha]|uniref:LOW QUALITY PROTEIN: uncharacterized protein LOC127854901 n=1 Tax=Dreissena polymorpha TaxID=45954 RepID=UPI00226469D7|nr:LOW QUALITY PROTEIN: uncharacterized protein LOC127854901 [Dreissena polymorpha]